MKLPDSMAGSSQSAETLFRYLVVSKVLADQECGLVRAEAVAATAAQEHWRFDGTMRRVSERTVYRWLQAYKQQGPVGLIPSERTKTADSVVLSRPLLDFLQAQKTVDARASIPEVLRRAREAGVVKPGEDVDRTTVWRAAKRMGLSTRRRRAGRRGRDTRRFAYPHRMNMVLSDGKHFRAGASRLRRVALFFLDDATRFGLHVVVGTSENTELFLRGLYETIVFHGLMSILYLDHGPGFKSLDTADVVSKLGVLLILGTVAYPEGHGKIERFHRTASDQLLRGLDRRPDVDPDCGALQVRLQHFLREVYNHTPHEGLGGATPAQRWRADGRRLRLPESRKALRDKFVVHLQRDVSNDHVVSVDSVPYEVPRGHATETVTIQRHVLDSTLSMLHDGQMITLKPADLEKNARERRARPQHDDDPAGSPPARSAADMAFEREFAPVVDADGGFDDPE